MGVRRRASLLMEMTSVDSTIEGAMNSSGAVSCRQPLRVDKPSVHCDHAFNSKRASAILCQASVPRTLGGDQALRFSTFRSLDFDLNDEAQSLRYPVHYTLYSCAHLTDHIPYPKRRWRTRKEKSSTCAYPTLPLPCVEPHFPPTYTSPPLPFSPLHHFPS